MSYELKQLQLDNTSTMHTSRYDTYGSMPWNDSSWTHLNFPIGYLHHWRNSWIVWQRWYDSSIWIWWQSG